MAEESAEEEGAVNVPTGTFKVLVRTSNSRALQTSKVIKPGHKGRISGHFTLIDDKTFSKIFKTASRQEDIQKGKLLALHESIRASLLDELKRFSRVHWTTDLASVEDARYILDYVADSYSCGKDRDQQQFKLSTGALLVMKDALEDKEVLNKWLGVNTAFNVDEEPMLNDFYQEVASTVAQEVFNCLLENGRLRR